MNATQNPRALPETIEECLKTPNNSPITCLKFNPFGTILATGCKDGSIVLWDYDTRSPIRIFSDGHSKDITSLVWDPNTGDSLLSASLDGCIVLWDVLTCSQKIKKDFHFPIAHIQCCTLAEMDDARSRNQQGKQKKATKKKRAHKSYLNIAAVQLEDVPLLISFEATADFHHKKTTTRNRTVLAAPHLVLLPLFIASLSLYCQGQTHENPRTSSSSAATADKDNATACAVPVVSLHGDGKNARLVYHSTSTVTSNSTKLGTKGKIINGSNTADDDLDDDDDDETNNKSGAAAAANGDGSDKSEDEKHARGSTAMARSHQRHSMRVSSSSKDASRLKRKQEISHTRTSKKEEETAPLYKTARALFLPESGYVFVALRGMVTVLKYLGNHESNTDSPFKVVDAYRLPGQDGKVPDIIDMHLSTAVSTQHPSMQSPRKQPTDRFSYLLMVTTTQPTVFIFAVHVAQGVDERTSSLLDMESILVQQDKIPRQGSLRACFPSASITSTTPRLPSTNSNTKDSINNLSMKLIRGFKADIESPSRWGVCSFSPNNGHHAVCALPSITHEHIMYTWNIPHGYPENILQSGRDGIIAMEWHPDPNPLQLLVVGRDSGQIYIWTRIMSQSWSTFAPDFETLHENREHIESETEFDIYTEGYLEEKREDGDDDSVVNVHGQGLLGDDSDVEIEGEEDGGERARWMESVLLHLPVEIEMLPKVMEIEGCGGGGGGGEEGIEGQKEEQAVKKRGRPRKAGIPRVD